MNALAPIRWLGRQAVRQSQPAEEAFDPGAFTPRLTTQLLVLQPTPFCNIRCDYCYLPHRDSTARMSPETAALAVQRLADDGLLGDSLGVVWHAGEPLVMPTGFYDEAIHAIHEAARPGCRIDHSLQTNAMLIDDDWCALFQRHAIRVGVSIDGPADLHDAHRRTRQGGGTHARVMQGLAALRAHGIGFHAIAVVTADTLDRLDDFIAFFEAEGIADWGCNFDEAEGIHAESSLAGRDAAHQTFTEALFARAMANEGRWRLREFDQAMRLVTEPMPRYRWRGEAWPHNVQAMPFAIVNVACTGDFSSFSPELLGQRSADFKDFVLGNVHRGGYLDATRHEPFQSLWRAIRRGNRRCRDSCTHFEFCGGGAPANKLYENGAFDTAETLYCRSTLKRPFDIALAQAERFTQQRAG